MNETGIILCADDYAMTPGVSAGIRHLAALGRLSATSCMTNRPHWPQDAELIAPLRERIALGLHVNLTLGAPLSACPALAPAGTFMPLPRLLSLALRGIAPLDEIAAEIEAQLDAFVAATGHEPAFIDGHQHVHALPGIRTALIDALSRRGLEERVWLRDPADSVGAILRRGGQVGKALAVRALAAGFGRAAREAGFTTNRGFAGFSAFDPREDYGKAMGRYLTAPGAGHLVMCHPGEVDEEIRGLDPAVESRKVELDYLASDAFGDLLARRALRLVQSPPA